MAWKLANADLALDFDIRGSGISGSLTYQEITYTVEGVWVAANSKHKNHPERVPNSAFMVWGQLGYPPVHITSTVIMDGSVDVPTEIDIHLGLAS